MSLGMKRLFANAGVLMGGTTAGMALGFLHTFIIARALGPASFGVWSSVLAYCSVLGSFLTFRTAEPVTRYLVEYRQQGDRERMILLLASALAVDLVTSAAAMLAIGVSAWFLADLLPGGREVLLVYIVCGGQQIGGIIDPVWFSVARDQGHYRTLAGLSALLHALKVLVLLPWWFLGTLDIHLVASLTLAAIMVQVSLNAVLLLRALRRGYALEPRDLMQAEIWRRRREISAFWSFMNATFLWSMFSTLLKEADVLLLGFLRPEAEAGWYRLAKTLAGTVMRVGEMLAQVIYQDLSELVAQKNMAELRQRIVTLCRTWLPLVTVGTGVGILLAPVILPMVFGADYGPSVFSFQILMVGSGLVTAMFWVRPMALAFELHWYNFRVIVVSGLLFTPLNLLLVVRWGDEGAALVQTLSWAFGYAALAWPVARRLWVPKA